MCSSSWPASPPARRRPAVFMSQACAVSMIASVSTLSCVIASTCQATLSVCSAEDRAGTEDPCSASPSPAPAGATGAGARRLEKLLDIHALIQRRPASSDARLLSPFPPSGTMASGPADADTRVSDGSKVCVDERALRSSGLAAVRSSHAGTVSTRGTQPTSWQCTPTSVWWSVPPAIHAGAEFGSSSTCVSSVAALSRRCERAFITSEAGDSGSLLSSRWLVPRTSNSRPTARKLSWRWLCATARSSSGPATGTRDTCSHTAEPEADESHGPAADGRGPVSACPVATPMPKSVHTTSLACTVEDTWPPPPPRMASPCCLDGALLTTASTLSETMSSRTCPSAPATRGKASTTSRGRAHSRARSHGAVSTGTPRLAHSCARLSPGPRGEGTWA
mmetsp:Transcript_22577/g.70712  ORF Transcript_22577/g.70712 Transcript_22577/m.70712 type:complete len:393 (-) Transcript_22577:3548-4726(-)